AFGRLLDYQAGERRGPPLTSSWSYHGGVPESGEVDPIRPREPCADHLPVHLGDAVDCARNVVVVLPRLLAAGPVDRGGAREQYAGDVGGPRGVPERPRRRDVHIVGALGVLLGRR